MEDAGGQQSIGACFHRRGEVFDLAGSARGDERHVHGGAGGPDEFEIESLACAVGVDGVEQDFADPAVGGFADPVDGAAARAFAAAAGGDFESGFRARPLGPARVEGQDEDLVAPLIPAPSHHFFCKNLFFA